MTKETGRLKEQQHKNIVEYGPFAHHPRWAIRGQCLMLTLENLTGKLMIQKNQVKSKIKSNESIIHLLKTENK